MELLLSNKVVFLVFFSNKVSKLLSISLGSLFTDDVSLPIDKKIIQLLLA